MITLTNTGSMSLTVAGIALAGANPSDFAESTTCGTTVSPNGSCTITVTFSPLGNFARTASLTVNDNAVGSPQTATLTGSGLSGQVTVSPSSLIFPAQSIGTLSSPRNIILTNAGTATFAISSIAVGGANAGDFSETNGCDGSLSPNASCTISVAFSPAALGTRTAWVTIADSLFSSPQTAALTGTGSGAVVTLAPGALTFAGQSLGTTSATQSVTLTNTGNTTLTITSLGAAGANPGDFTVTDTCGSSVAVNASCTILAAFTPATIGNRTTSVSIADNAGGSPQTVSLSGSGSAPSASITTASLAFSSQNLGTTSAAQTFSLNNTGNAPLTISGIALTGANSGDYGETSTCGSSLAAAGSCSISVTFTPAAAGNRTATLSITDNSSNVAGSRQSVSLSGMGTGPFVSVPSTLSFGSQSQGVASTPETISVTNTGNASLNITSVAVTGGNAGDFAETNTCLGTPVAANGGTCTISVTFTPTAINSRVASITIVDNAPASPQVVMLTGTGTASVASLSAVTLNFGNQPILTAGSPQTITLTNTGQMALTITAVSVTGANAGDFAETNTCPLSPGSLAATDSCTITVTLTPSAPGSRVAAVNIADNATAGSPQVVSLIGTGIGGSVGLSAASLSFGTQSVGSTSAAQGITVTNTGNANLTITRITVTGSNAGDFAETNTCSGSLAVNGTCAINVTFTPTTAGMRTAGLTLTDSATNSPQTVSLTGTGSTPIASLSPTTFTFTSQPATTGSSPQSFTLSNTGNATLDITSIAFVGANAGDFSQNTTCGATLAANANCTIVATFTPAAAGSRSGTLVVTDNSNNTAGSTQSSLLAGTGTHDVMLSWTASSTPGVMGYYVFRATVSGAESTTPLNSSPATPLSFVDTSVAGGTTYYYVVTAVASDGITQSSPSNEASAQVPTP